jgi:signal transduction histidine kinase
MPAAPHTRRRARLAVWLPVLILLAGAAGSAVLALEWQRSIDTRDRTEFDGAVAESTAAVASEFQRTEDVLRGIRGVFASSRNVMAPEFRDYVASLNMRERFPSVHAIAFTSAVPTRDLAQFAAAQRRAGNPRFAITTAPGSDPRLKGDMLRRIVTFVEPPSTAAGRPGYDVWGLRAPRAAHDRATDTGGAALSPKLMLQPRVPGVSIALAVYRPGARVRTVAQRRAAVRGWVVARVGAQDFAAGVRTPRARRLGIEIFDGDRAAPAALLARVPAALPSGTRNHTLHAIAGGHEWTVRYAALGSSGASREPLGALLAGLALSALLAALVRTQMAGRQRADREVFERTAQLRATTADLRAANAELEAHNREVEAFARRQRDFVATASHELRTPLTSILGYLELVLGARPADLRDEERGHLQIVYRSGKRLLAIVGDLLTVDKTDAGAMEIRPAVTTADVLFAPTVDAFAAACAAKGLTLTVEAEPVGLNVDAQRMQQVLANIVGNAVKLTPAPGEVRLAARAVGDRAELRVADTGPGIAPEELPHLFDRFYRTEASMRAATPGTGLGLTIARSLVEAHDGTLTVESEVGGGTTFVISLPAVAIAGV